jgi:hypothetical protein
MLKIAKSYWSQHCPTMVLSWMTLFKLVLLCMPIAVLQNNCRRIVFPALAGEIAAQVYPLSEQILKLC